MPESRAVWSLSETASRCSDFARRRVRLAFLPPLGDERTARLDSMREHRGQLGRLLLQQNLAARDARYIQQVVHQPAQVLNLAFEHVAQVEQ